LPEKGLNGQITLVSQNWADIKVVSWISHTQIPPSHTKISVIREGDAGMSDVLNIFCSMILCLSDEDAWGKEIRDA